MHLPRRVATLLAAAALASAALTGTASAEDDPPFVPWTQLLPGLTGAYEPSSANLCNRGDLRCVNALIREMTRRFDTLAPTCDHDAVFALTYLRTTEEFRVATTTPDFFSDPPFLNHEAAVFASYYFQAYDDWHAGRRSQVPQAWVIALDAADRRQVSAAGNLLLGMSAHVNRDLPYVLEAIGLVRPDGSSRKPDHDKVDEFLNRVTMPLIAEISRRFDPSVNGTNVQGTTLDETTLFQLIAAWRETAWRNAELLVNAPTPAARALVSQTIETQAATVQQTLELQNAYVPPLTSSAGRDAWCAQHWDDA
ncbi:MAG TPA: DUF5995 family protein [Actinomycetes bacterium]|nr:DUF5995 family protein [Actinomycetes bacterium]